MKISRIKEKLKGTLKTQMQQNLENLGNNKNSTSKNTVVLVRVSPIFAIFQAPPCKVIRITIRTNL